MRLRKLLFHAESQEPHILELLYLCN